MSALRDTEATTLLVQKNLIDKTRRVIMADSTFPQEFPFAPVSNETHVFVGKADGVVMEPSLSCDNRTCLRDENGEGHSLGVSASPHILPAAVEARAQVNRLVERFDLMESFWQMARSEELMTEKLSDPSLQEVKRLAGKEPGNTVKCSVCFWKGGVLYRSYQSRDKQVVVPCKLCHKVYELGIWFCRVWTHRDHTYEGRVAEKPLLALSQMRPSVVLLFLLCLPAGLFQRQRQGGHVEKDVCDWPVLSGESDRSS